MKKRILILMSMLLATGVMQASLSKEAKLIEAVKEGKVDDVRNLLESGVDLSNEDLYIVVDGRTRSLRRGQRTYPLLALSLKRRCADIAKLLIEYGANLNEEGLVGKTPLLSAAGKGLHEIVFILLSRDVNPNQIGSRGQTPLHRAARNGCMETINHLLNFSADPTITDMYNEKPGHLAKDAKIKQILEKKAKEVIRRAAAAAFAQADHPRLGAGSPARVLNRELFPLICRYL